MSFLAAQSQKFLWFSHPLCLNPQLSDKITFGPLQPSPKLHRRAEVLNYGQKKFQCLQNWIKKGKFRLKASFSIPSSWEIEGLIVGLNPGTSRQPLTPDCYKNIKKWFPPGTKVCFIRYNNNSLVHTIDSSNANAQSTPFIRVLP